MLNFKYTFDVIMLKHYKTGVTNLNNDVNVYEEVLFWKFACVHAVHRHLNMGWNVSYQYWW